MLSADMKNTGRYEQSHEIYERPKFWEYEIRETTVTIHFGKIGTRGIRASRDFISQDAAKEFVEKRLEEKLNEGFKLIEEN